MLSQRFPWPLAVIVASAVVILFFVALNQFGVISLGSVPQHYSISTTSPIPSPTPTRIHGPSEFGLPSHTKYNMSVTATPAPSWSFENERDSLNLGLSDDQCDAAFPDLYDELDRARDWHQEKPLGKNDVKIWRGDDGLKHGQVHILIHGGQLYIVDEKSGDADGSRAKAAVASMYRALSALPDPRKVPDVEFVIDVEDNLHGTPKDRTVWAWCRHRDDNNTFVMPDFDGWSYPDDAVGGYEAFRTKVRGIEQPFEEKIPKAVWRGSTGVNHDLRVALVDAAKGRPWADIKEIDWSTRKGVMQMQDFCKYQYVVQTEGNSWSGRLRYLHNCLSVPIIHDLDYIASYYPLLKADGPNQNYIPVRRDFADLELQMQYYLSKPEEGVRVARESAATFRDRYLTPAAEACYWRRMFKRWSEIQDFKPALWEDVEISKGLLKKPAFEQRIRGVSFERWAFRGEKSFEHGIMIENKPVGGN